MALQKIKVAVILCGGFGTRLKAVVNDKPKPMADFNGQPFLGFLIEQLYLQGIETVILSTGYMSEYIESYTHHWSSKINIKVISESKALGTGGALKNVLSRQYLDTFILLNGDSYCQVDLESMEFFHTKANSQMTMLLTKVDDVSDFGTVLLTSENLVTSFIEKNNQRKAGWVNAGVYILSDEIKAFFPKEESFSLEYDVFPKLFGSRFFGYKVQTSLYDIGTPESYARALSELGKERL